MKNEEKNEELILYKYEDDKNKNKKKKEDVYNKILKAQNKNAIISSISTFLYMFSLTFLLVTANFFNEIELQWICVLVTVIIILVASILKVFVNKKKPKEGVIKYKYKNEEFFYIAVIFINIGAFIIFLGIDVSALLTIGLVLLDIGVAFYGYHGKTKGTKKIGFLKKLMILFLTLIISVVSGTLVGEKTNLNNDYVSEYFKSAMVIYDEIDRPILLKKSNDTWYVFTNQYKTNHYELSVSDKPEQLNIVYETDNVSIWNLDANSDYAVWTEVKKNVVMYTYYDKEENQTYELMTLTYTNQEPQITNVGLYKNKIYYEIIDYENVNFKIMEYNVLNGENKIIYAMDGKEKTDVMYNTLNVDENSLLATTRVNGRLMIIHLDLAKKDYNQKTISTKKYNAIAYSVSYDNDKYALYYWSNQNQKLAIFNKSGKQEKVVYKFNSNNYALYDKIKLKDDNLYWIDIKINNQDQKNNHVNLMVYDLSNKNTQKISNIFEFDVNDKTIYALGYYKNNKESVRLYEVYN